MKNILLLFFICFGQWTLAPVYGVSFNTTSSYGELTDEAQNNIHTWALNIPELEFVVTSDIVNIPSTVTVIVTLTLKSSTVLSGSLVVANNNLCVANPSPANFVVGCNKSTGKGLIVTATLKNVTDLFNNSALKLTETSSLISGFNYPPATLLLKECDTGVENAIPETSQSTCGFQCGANFTCSTGYQIVEKNTYVCSANAAWSPTIPSSLCIPETTTVTVDPTTSTTKSDPETTTESPPTELPPTEPLITEGSPTNCTEEEICCECIAGIVIMVISAPASVVFLGFIVFVLVQDGSDFVRDNLAICIAGLCGVILAIVCAAILLSKCKSCEHWTGGDIACVVLGWIGAIGVVIVCIYLIHKWCDKEYSLGKAR